MFAQFDCAPHTYTLHDATRPNAYRPQAQSFLFEISHAEKASSFVLGTFHSDHPDVLERWDAVAVLAAAAQPRVFYTERMFENDTKGVIDARRFDDTTTLSKALESAPGLYDVTLQHLNRAHAPNPMRSQYKPWFVATWLNQARAQRNARGTGHLDATLYKAARRLGLTMRGLETLADLSEKYTRLDAKEQILLLSESVCNAQRTEPLGVALSDAYSANDVGDFYATLGRYQSQHRALSQKLTTMLLDERNAAYWRTLVPEFKKGGVMVAVGNLHVQGEGGIYERAMAQFATAGFSVREITTLNSSTALQAFADLADWVVKWSSQELAPFAPNDMPFETLAIRHEPEARLSRRLCPENTCRVEATYDPAAKTLSLNTDTVMMLVQSGRDFVVHVDGRAVTRIKEPPHTSDRYAESIVVRGLMRHLIHASLAEPSNRADATCLRALALHHASVAQQGYLTQMQAKARAHIFPLEPACAEQANRLLSSRL